MDAGHDKSYGLWLNGQWLVTDDKIEVVNPATGQAFARVSTVNRDHVRRALETGQAAFPAWRATTAKHRGILPHKVADELLRRQEEIARTITLENGKPLAQSRGEVGMSIDHLRWFAEEGRRAYARIFRLSEQIEAGTLGINDGAPTTSQSPFGGVKQSGWGRELGSEGLEAFLETKHVSIGGI